MLFDLVAVYTHTILMHDAAVVLWMMPVSATQQFFFEK